MFSSVLRASGTGCVFSWPCIEMIGFDPLKNRAVTEEIDSIGEWPERIEVQHQLRDLCVTE